ncbi:MAG TPA: trypsin-like peptidase domain-containing protein [Pirellulaceae bacterium]|jgi:serine protease Do|nr:trypsin-like peptidase domain-containing protein [Pirellulaceae bacterium]
MKAWWQIAAAFLLATTPVLADDPQPNGAPSAQNEAKADDAAEASQAKRADDADAKSADKATADKKGEWIARLFGNQRYGRYQKNNDAIRDVFKASMQQARKATAAIVSDDDLLSLGAIVDSEGLIVTKASELKGDLVIRLYDGAEYPARVVATDAASDIAMLKIEASDLPTVEWADQVPEVGSWLATASVEDRPLALGVVSVAPRDVPAPNAVIGVYLGDDPAGVRINRVLADSGAWEAGILVNDVVQAVNGESVKNREELMSRVKQHRAGDRILLKIKRGDESILLGAVLKYASQVDPDDRKEFQNSLGGRLSERRGGFSGVLQHDTVLQPQYCGGPIVDLDGKVVGINICRAGRVESYALTSVAVKDLLTAMKAGENSATAASALRKAEIERLTKLVDEHLTVLQEERAKREAAANDAKQALAQAQKALAEAEAAKPAVGSQVEAARNRVEEAKSRVQATEKAFSAIDSSIKTTQGEADKLSEEMSGLTKS